MGYAICNIDFGMEAPVLVFVILYLRKLRFFVGDLGFDPGSLNRATGEKVTVSEVFPVLRGTDNRQSVLGSWGLLQLERVVQKGILRYLYFEVIEGRVANGAVTWVVTAWNTRLPSLGFVLNSTGFKSGLALPSLSNLACRSIWICIKS